MNKRVFAAVAVVAALGMTACNKSSSTSGSETDGNWVKAATFGGDARGYAVAFTIGNYAYVGTGNGSGSTSDNKSMSDFWEFDGNSWTQVASMPKGRYQASSFVANNKAYVVGGRYYDTYGTVSVLNDMYSYDPTSNSWTSETAFPGTARARAVAFSLNNVGFYGTGEDIDNNRMADFFKYDPSAKTWSSITSLPGDKRAGASVFILNSKAYIVAGQTNTGLASDFYDFDGTTWGTLRSIANINTSESYDDDYTDIQRYDGTAFVIDGVPYLTTGSISGTATQKTWAYKSSNDTWYRKTPYVGRGVARYGAISFVLNNVGYVGLGTNGSSRQDNLSYFEPHTDYNENSDLY